MATEWNEFGQFFADRPCRCTGGRRYTKHVIALGIRECLECGALKEE